MAGEFVRFDRSKLNRLIKAYNHAKENNKETFVFDGQEYHVTYATYLIEFLKTKLK